MGVGSDHLPLRPNHERHQLWGGVLPMTTLVYAYGARIVSDPQPVMDQIRASLRYRNALVAQEIARRERSDEAIRLHYPGLAALALAAETAKSSIEAARDKIRADNTKAGRKRGGDLAELRGTNREAWAAFKAAKKAAYADERCRAALEEIQSWDGAERRKLRAECEAYWGTYIQTERSMCDARKGPPPQFRPHWMWHGKIGVQLQGGATWGDLLEGHGQCEVEALPLASTTGRRSKRPFMLARLRIGSEGPRNRVPIWATWRFSLHRPLPVGARIKEVAAVRRRVGTHDEWSMQFTIECERTRADTATANGSAGIDLGWRMLEDGSMRVAYVAGSDGTREELTIPADRISRWTKCDSLESIRDREFNAAREVFASWLASATVPDWMREATETLAQWRAQARLAALVIRWRAERFDGDGEAFDRAEAWRKQDKHLMDWAAYQRRNCEAWRLDTYRRFAARLRWTFRRIAVEGIDWRDLAQKPQAEDDTESINRRFWMRIASPGLLRKCIEAGHPDVVRVGAEHTTTTCSICGSAPIEGWDAMRNLYLVCKSGHRIDQDENAAINLLALASDAVESAEKPLKKRAPRVRKKPRSQPGSQVGAGE